MNSVQLNTCFELVGACLAVHNVMLAAKTRPQGVSRLMVAWSALWALQCGPYYLSHGEHVSAFCAAVRGVCAAVWLAFALRPRAASGAE